MNLKKEVGIYCCNKKQRKQELQIQILVKFMRFNPYIGLMCQFVFLAKVGIKY